MEENKNIDFEKQQLEKEKAAFEREKRAFQNLKADKTKKELELDMLKPVLARMKNRIREITKLSQAKNEKIMRGNMPHWIYTPPEMHISQLNATMNNGVVKITYYVYKTDKIGNKLLQEHKGTVTGPDGKQKEIVTSANYIFDKMVVETIEHLKQRVVEEFKENE